MAEYVVVLLAGSDCPEAPPDHPTRCVMDVYGPFPDKAKAAEFADTQPAWTTPHFMRLQSVNDA